MLNDLRNIPRIQRGLGWINGAVLLEKWFSRPATAFPRFTAADTTTIKMDSFVLTFQRAREVYERLVQDKIWCNAAAQPAVATMLRRKGALTTSPRSFGSLADPVPSQDPDYINQRPHNNPTPPPSDDLTAALANFNFRVVVAGMATPNPTTAGAPPTWRIEIREVGVYVRDSFDFDGFQPLGCWDDSPDGFSLVPAGSPVFIPTPFGTIPAPTRIYTPVFNSTFRDWRTANGRGGDFEVFSDLKRLPLSPPDTFVVS